METNLKTKELQKFVRTELVGTYPMISDYDAYLLYQQIAYKEAGWEEALEKLNENDDMKYILMSAYSLDILKNTGIRYYEELHGMSNWDVLRIIYSHKDKDRTAFRIDGKSFMLLKIPTYDEVMNLFKYCNNYIRDCYYINEVDGFWYVGYYFDYSVGGHVDITKYKCVDFNAYRSTVLGVDVTRVEFKYTGTIQDVLYFKYEVREWARRNHIEPKEYNVYDLGDNLHRSITVIDTAELKLPRIKTGCSNDITCYNSNKEATYKICQKNCLSPYYVIPV